MSQSHRSPIPVVIIAGLLSVLTGTATAAPPDAVEQRLDRLEARWDHLEAELVAMRAALERVGAIDPKVATVAPEVTQRLSAVEDYANSLNGELGDVKATLAAQDQMLNAQSVADAQRLSLSSYGNFVAADRNNGNSVFDAESFEIVLSGQPHDRIGFFSELEFERAATVGADRGGEVLVEQAYVDFALSDAIALRSGVLLMPFGNVAADHYAPLRDMISKPLSSFAIVPSDWTDNGFGLVGDASLSDTWHFNYEAYLVAGLGQNIGPQSLRGGRQGFGVDNNSDKALIAHFGFSHGDNVRVGFAGYRGAYDDAGNRQLTGFGLDWNIQQSAFKVAGELLRMQAQRPGGMDAVYWGGYLRTGYELSRWLPVAFSGESFPDAKLFAFYQYDYVDADDITSLLGASTSEWQHSFGFRYEATRNWIFKVNYEISRAGRLPIRNGDSRAILAAIGYVF